MELSTMSPKEVRALIRDGVITHQTSGMCGGYAQANLCILPKDYAFDFLLFCMRNPKPCPILAVTSAQELSERWPTAAISAAIFQNTVYGETACSSAK